MTKKTIILAFLLIPCTARANGFMDASFELNSDTAQIVLQANAPIAEPSVRIDRGIIKVRFPEMTEQRWLKPSVDGKAVRAVAVYPSSQDTAVIRINLGDNRMLKRDDIDIDSQNNQTRIRIAREALPEALDPPKPKPVEAHNPAERTEKANLDLGLADQQKTADDRNGEQPISPLVTSPVSKRKDRSAVLSVLAPTPSSAGLGTIGLRGGSSVAILLIASLILLSIYVAMKLFLVKKAKASGISNIEVIGAKRLGARHQLVLVRALGEDHLLSINAGRTERIASIPSPQPVHGEEGPEEYHALEGLFSRWQKTASESSERGVREGSGSVMSKLPTYGTGKDTPALDLLQFGKRNSRSPLEKLNIFDTERANQSGTKRESMRFRNRTAD